MTPANYIALSALAISIFSLVFSYVTSTKKYELTVSQRSELLKWYQETVALLITMREYISADAAFDKIASLAKLSALIEQGRFYFPNIDLKDGFGAKKPSAYRGYREITLEYLVFSYDLMKQDNATINIEQLTQLQRQFTSRIFDILSPREYNKIVKKYTMLPMDKGMSLEDLLEADPSRLKDFFG